MELAKLQKRLKTSKEGHKLLKDKQDEFMRVFLNYSKEANRLRGKVNEALSRYSREIGFSVSSFQPQVIRNTFLSKDITAYANIQEGKWMGIPLVNISCDVRDIKIPSALASTPQLAKTVHGMREILPDLVNLTITTENCALIAAETEVIRRRVNALEHRVIPELERNIRTIKMKLSDGERDTITRLIKIKNMDR